MTAGWGFSTNGEIDLRQYLKFLPVPTYDSDKCNATSHYAGFITEHDICVGFTDTDKGPCYVSFDIMKKKIYLSFLLSLWISAGGKISVRKMLKN